MKAFFFCTAIACCAAGLLITDMATAQELADPTRPAGAVERALPAAAPGVAGTVAPRTWPQLQSVQIPAQGAASALVDGRVVRVGERIGDVTVVAIDAEGILLRAARYEQRIALVPGIVKTASAPTPISRTAVAAASKETP